MSERDLPKALGRLRDQSNLSEVVILSTCLRTEIYAVVERFHDGVAALEEFLATTSGSPADSLAEHFTVRFDDDVTNHLFAVAAGLDSAVLGESEVLGQVRRAWEQARSERVSGPVLGALFRHAVETGKRVRSETAIARGITSLSHGAVALAARHRDGGLGGARVLVVGAGEMGEGVTQALAGGDTATLVVANRTPDRTEAVVAALPPDVASRVRSAALDDLAGLMASSDVVFTSVGTTHPIVDRAMVEAAVTGRGPGDPLLVVDLGVPRNVEPSAARSRRAGAARHGGAAIRGLRRPVRARGGGGRCQPHRRRRGGALPGGLPGPRCRPHGVGPQGEGRRGPPFRARPAAVEAVRAVRGPVGAGRCGDQGDGGQAAPSTDRGPQGRGRHSEGRAPGRSAPNAVRSLVRGRPVSVMTGPLALRLATRGSPLAMWQARRVEELLHRSGVSTSLVVVETTGDRRLDVPLDRLGGQGVFVKEVQAAVIGGEADAAVHSAKDLPASAEHCVPGLVLAAFPERADARDVLVGGRLASLPVGATVATGSARRRVQLANLRPDLTFAGLRGNLATRLATVGRRRGSGGVRAQSGGCGAVRAEWRSGGGQGRARPVGLVPTSRARARGARHRDDAAAGGAGGAGRRVPGGRRRRPARAGRHRRPRSPPPGDVRAGVPGRAGWWLHACRSAPTPSWSSPAPSPTGPPSA